MASQIYLNEEVEELEVVENQEKWNELCFELGLEGQQKLSAKKEGANSAIPYMRMDTTTQNIIAVLCPDTINYKNYSASAIPLDILKEIKKCDENGWFEQIEIHYDAANKDPFVVGRVKDNEYDWRKSKFVIGRFGDEALPWEELEIKAKNKLRITLDSKLANLKSEITKVEGNKDTVLAAMLQGASYFTGSSISASSSLPLF